MKLMKTAEEMMQFCVDHKTGCYSYKYLNHFKVIENCLQTDEYAIFCIEGNQIIDLDFRSIRDRRYSFVLTNKRLIMGQNSDMGDDLQIVWYKDLYGIELVDGSLVVDGTKSVPCIQITTEDVSYLRNQISEIMAEIRRKKAAANAVGGNNSADEIREFKGLFDDGIITEEEFLKKKRQLLDRDDASEYTGMGAEIAIDINPADYMPINDSTAKDNTENWSVEGMMIDNDRTIARVLGIGIIIALGVVVYFFQHM